MGQSATAPSSQPRQLTSFELQETSSAAAKLRNEAFSAFDAFLVGTIDEAELREKLGKNADVAVETLKEMKALHDKAAGVLGQ